MPGQSYEEGGRISHGCPTLSSLSSREDESSFGAIWDFYIWALGPLSPSVGQSLSWRGNIGAFHSVKILDLSRISKGTGRARAQRTLLHFKDTNGGDGEKKQKQGEIKVVIYSYSPTANLGAASLA